MNETIVSKDDVDELKLLSKGVVVCLEIMSSFSVDGKYIASDNFDRRISTEQVNTLYESLYGELTRLSFTKPQKLQRMSTKRILKMIHPAHSFIIDIYRNGTPNYRFKRMRVDESVTDKIIIDQFAIEFKNSLVQGVANYVADFTKQYYDKI